jgi:hypothetical protein
MARQRKDLFVEMMELKSVNGVNLTVSDRTGDYLIPYTKKGNYDIYDGVYY